MNVFVEQLRLAEMAAENIYFARLDRKLIEALHRRMERGETAFRSPLPAAMRPVGIQGGAKYE